VQIENEPILFDDGQGPLTAIGWSGGMSNHTPDQLKFVVWAICANAS
jgi:hypothetical protein